MHRTADVHHRPVWHWLTPMLALLGGLMLALLPTSAMAQEVSFPDVGGDSAHANGVEWMAGQGISIGFTDGTFRPFDDVSRGQMASFLDRALDLPEGDPADFSDVDADSTHGQAIANLAASGITQGFGDGTFRPELNVARAQTASFVYRGLTTEVKLLGWNDFHGRIGTSDSPDAAYFSTHLNTIRDAQPNTLFVDAGDLVGATPVLSNLFYDEATVDVMNAIGLDIQTVGNHEFDRGQDEILRRRDGGCFNGDCDYREGAPFDGQDFTTLSTNVTVDETGEALTQPYEIIDVDGVDIGFIGVTTEGTPEVVSPTGIEGLSFAPEAEAVNETVPLLQDAGADVIVVLMHEGGRQSGDANSCEDRRGAAASITTQFDDAVDVVVEGHTHEAYVCNEEDGPLITQADEYGNMFTDISLAFDAEGEMVLRRGWNREVTQDVEPDPEVVEVIEFYDDLAGDALEEIVGHSEVEIPRTTREEESIQGNLATDALIDQYVDQDIDFAFQNSGGLRADLTTLDQDEDGLYPIRLADVLEVWPFGNIVALAEVDGPLLEEILQNGVEEIGGGRFIQVAGLRIEYSIDDTADGDFPRGVIETVEYWNHPDFDDGEEVDLSASSTYRIAMNDFMSVGGDNYPDIRDEVFSLSEPLELVVEQYLRDNSPVNPQIEGRIVGPQ